MKSCDHGYKDHDMRLLIILQSSERVSNIGSATVKAHMDFGMAYIMQSMVWSNISTEIYILNTVNM